MVSPSCVSQRSAGGRVLQVERYFAGDRKGFDRQSEAGAGSGEVGSLPGLELHPRDEACIEHVEDAIGRQRAEHTARAVERECEAFAQAEQPGDVVDVTVGQDHGLDGAFARRGMPARREVWRCGDLLTQVRRGVEKNPALAVAADRDR